jgi:hypothetical protein
MISAFYVIHSTITDYAACSHKPPPPNYRILECHLHFPFRVRQGLRMLKVIPVILLILEVKGKIWDKQEWKDVNISKLTVFWDVAPCSLVEIYRRLRGAPEESSSSRDLTMSSSCLQGLGPLEPSRGYSDCSNHLIRGLPKSSFHWGLFLIENLLVKTCTWKDVRQWNARFVFPNASSAVLNITLALMFVYDA